jgi:hypothetical protein
LVGGTTTTTRAKDSDGQDNCTILDNALNDGELSMRERRERISAATSVATSPAKFGGWGMLSDLFVVSVLLGVGIGWGLSGNTRSPLDLTTDPGAKPDGVAAVVLTLPRSCIRSAGLPA